MPENYLTTTPTPLANRLAVILVFQHEGNFQFYPIVCYFAVFYTYILVFDPGARDIFERFASAFNAFTDSGLKTFSGLGGDFGYFCDCHNISLRLVIPDEC